MSSYKTEVTEVIDEFLPPVLNNKLIKMTGIPEYVYLSYVLYYNNNGGERYSGTCDKKIYVNLNDAINHIIQTFKNDFLNDYNFDSDYDDYDSEDEIIDTIFGKMELSDYNDINSNSSEYEVDNILTNFEKRIKNINTKKDHIQLFYYSCYNEPNQYEYIIEKLLLE